MSRRIYNIKDLQQLTKFKDISQQDANQVLTLAYNEFAKIKTLEKITDKVFDNDKGIIIYEGKLINITMNTDSYNAVYGGENHPPKKIVFSSNPTNWNQTDDVYFLFNNYVKNQENNLHYSIIGFRETKKSLVAAFKELKE